MRVLPMSSFGMIVVVLNGYPIRVYFLYNQTAKSDMCSVDTEQIFMHDTMHDSVCRVGIGGMVKPARYLFTSSLS